MDYIYHVKFKYEPDFDRVTPLVKMIKAAYEERFVNLRHFACDKLNGMYETWNKEFEAIGEFPQIEYAEDMIGTEYAKFLIEKQNEILNQVNEEYGDGLIWLESGPDCDIIGKTYDGRTINAYLIPAE